MIMGKLIKFDHILAYFVRINCRKMSFDIKMNVSLNSKIPNRIFSKPHGIVHLGPGNMKSAAAVLGQTKNLNLASGPMCFPGISSRFK